MFEIVVLFSILVVAIGAIALMAVIWWDVP